MHMDKTQQICTATDIGRLGTILFVAAHPDDETFCCGGLLATAVRNGQRVICVTATHGEKGVQDADKWPVDQLADIRAHELEAGLKELGITEHYWLDYHDGECDHAPEDDAAQSIAAIIERCSVDSVLTFGPDGLTGHPDHQSVSRWADAAVHIATRSPRVFHVVQPKAPYETFLKPADAVLNIFFMTDKPVVAEKNDCAIYFELDHRSVVQKYRALEVMPSQTTQLLRAFPAEKFGKVFGIEALVEATDART
jgi:LmbE family N-acetylglucosaminyl deacetylase